MPSRSRSSSTRRKRSAATRIQKTLRGKQGRKRARKFRSIQRNNAIKENECAICHEQLMQDVNVLPCSHRFHNECIESWITSHNSCPICRAPIVEEDELAIPTMNYDQALEARVLARAARLRAYDEYIEAGTNELDYREMYGADNSETYNTLLANYERASNSYNLARARLEEIMRIINQLS